MKQDPLPAFLGGQGFLVLDGGLATELEALGRDLDDPLWSASALLEAPEIVARAHRAFLEAGADCIATVTYQASFPGLRDRGLGDAEIRDTLLAAVGLAVEARDEFWATPANREERTRPIVAASVGPYGAFLADGSEYRGGYGLGPGDLYDFHAPRWEILAGSPADIIACETTPSVQETAAYCRLAAVSGHPVWISFQCVDERRIADGTALETVVAMCREEPHVAAVGVNCTSPAFIPALIDTVRSATDRPVLVYPNSGEEWDAEANAWRGSAASVDWAEAAREWRARGAAGVGGCCRVRPADIREIRRGLAGD